jgi:large subunit ribosomal protein L29
VKSTQLLQQLRQTNVRELEQQLRENRERLLKLRESEATRKLDNALVIRETRRSIARIMTVLRERQIKAEEEQRTA